MIRTFGVFFIAFGLFAAMRHEVSWTIGQRTEQIEGVSVLVKTKRVLPLPPLLAGVAIGSGLLLLVIGGKPPNTVHRK